MTLGNSAGRPDATVRRSDLLEQFHRCQYDGDDHRRVCCATTWFMRLSETDRDLLSAEA